MDEPVSQAFDPGSPERILLIRPSALGDVCRSVGVLVALRRRFPSARIDWLVQDSFVDAVRAHPDLDGVVAFPRRTVAIGRLWRPGAMRVLLSLLSSLRGARYDVVVDCQGLLRSGLFAWVTGARVRVGYREAAELGWLLLNRRVSAPRDEHTVDRMHRLCEALGAPRTRDLRLYTPADEANAWRTLGCAGRYVVIAPTSRWEGKRWPAHWFGELSRRLLDDGLAESVVLVGGRGEREQCAPLLEHVGGDRRVVDLIGRTSVGGLMSVIEHASLVVANDSAALHIGVGYGRPLVALFGPTDAALVGPYARERDVLSPGAPRAGVTHKDAEPGRELMRAIEPARVFEACERRLAGCAAGACA